MMEVIEHITRDNDRWDTIAWEYYGDATAYERIVAANPHVAITPVLPSGIRINVPVIVDPDTTTPEQMPPWLR